MKKLLSFAFIVLFLLGIFVSAKNDNESQDNHTWNNQESSNHSENYQEGSTSTGKETKKVFTGLSSGAIVCVTTAVVARDTAIKSWMAMYNATWITTFDARTAAFTAALSLTEKKEMKKAMELAWKTSEKAMKLAQKAKKDVVQKAWSDYRVSLKSCNAPIAKDLMQERGGNDLDD